MDSTTRTTMTDPSLDLAIQGMTCASCVRRVERALQRVPGVDDAVVNLANERARVTASPAVPADRLIAAVREAGYDATILAAPKTEAARAMRRQRRELWHVVAAALLSAPLLLGMAGDLLGLPLMLPGWAQLALAAPVQLWLGARFYVAGWKALRALTGNMDLLVALGTSAAFGLSLFNLLAAPADHMPPLYFESASLIITFVLLGRWLEARARGQTAAAVAALTRLRPDTARLRRDGADAEVPLGQIRIGDVVVVRAGERIPVDGSVIEGARQRRRVDAHRRKPAGRQAARCARDRRCAGDRRHAGDCGHRRRRRDHACRHRAAGRGRAGVQGADPAPCRSRQRGVRAGGAGNRGRHVPGLVVRLGRCRDGRCWMRSRCW